MKYQYRVVWQREGERRKTKAYATRAGAENYVNFMESDKPWEFVESLSHLHGSDGEDQLCCDGYQCGCNGESVGEHFSKRRAEFPKLIKVEIEAREVGSWAKLDQVDADSTGANAA